MDSRWRDKLLNSDIELTTYTRVKKNISKLEILYYPEENGVVRKEITLAFQERNKFYDKGLDED